MCVNTRTDSLRVKCQRRLCSWICLGCISVCMTDLGQSGPEVGGKMTLANVTPVKHGDGVDYGGHEVNL